MKIMVDGYAIGLLQGTGLTTYARELSELLLSRGHDVSALYGLNGIAREPDLRWPDFLQTLATKGEPHQRDYLLMALYSVLYGLGQLPNCEPRPGGIKATSWVDASSSANLPKFSEIYNLASVFNVAFARAALFDRPLTLNAPRSSGVELFHRTSPIPVRMRGVCNVVTAHDVIPLVVPHSTKANLKHYRRVLRNSICNADRIFVVSEHSREDISRVLNVDPDRMHVTYQAVKVPDSIRLANESDVAEQIWQEFGLDYGRYFLFYGAIEPKKNVLRLLDALARTRNDLPLVIVGRDGWLCKEELSRIRTICAQPAGARRLRRITYLPRRALMYLLRGARALVFPSIYEGFGLPPLEAMQMGVPVITSNRSSLPEVCGDAAVYVDPLDPAGIAEAMDRLAGDDQLCSVMVERGAARSAMFSPELHAERIEQGYRLALSGS